MAKSTKRKAAQLPPGTHIVDNPAWDRDAPDLDLAEQPRRGNQARSSQPVGKRPATVEHATGIAVQLLFGLVLAAGIGGGVWWWLGARQQGEVEAEAEAAAAEAAVAGTEAGAGTPPPTLEDIETRYAASVARTAAALAIEAPSLDRLLQPNAYSNPVTHGKPVVIAPGVTKRFGPLSLKVHVDTLALDRHEIRSKGEHTMLQLRNTADHPVAYRLNVRKKSNGDCLSLAVFNYDAMVIDAGATTEVSVCSGRQSAEILDLRMLSITEVGARWVRQIPPLAVGNTAIAARSHELADETIPQCNEDAADIARAIEEHLARWEDVIDFFSRHDCTEYAWVSEYRLARQALPQLPVLPEQPR